MIKMQLEGDDMEKDINDSDGPTAINATNSTRTEVKRFFPLFTLAPLVN